MSRPTDAQRGARLAFDIAVDVLTQPDLFADTPPTEFWESIRAAAFAQLEESAAFAAAIRDPQARALDFSRDA